MEFKVVAINGISYGKKQECMIFMKIGEAKTMTEEEIKARLKVTNVDF